MKRPGDIITNTKIFKDKIQNFGKKSCFGKPVKTCKQMINDNIGKKFAKTALKSTNKLQANGIKITKSKTGTTITLTKNKRSF
jgi:hypothetical protein